VLSQYAHEGFSGVVAIPPPGRQVAALASKRKFAAKNHGVTASCPIYVYCLGAHHLGRDIILPGGRPPVSVLRKGGRSPFGPDRTLSSGSVGNSKRACEHDVGYWHLIDILLADSDVRF